MQNTDYPGTIPADTTPTVAPQPNQVDPDEVIRSILAEQSGEPGDIINSILAEGPIAPYEPLPPPEPRDPSEPFVPLFVAELTNPYAPPKTGNVMDELFAEAAEGKTLEPGMAFFAMEDTDAPYPEPTFGAAPPEYGQAPAEQPASGQYAPPEQPTGDQAALATPYAAYEEPSGAFDHLYDEDYQVMEEAVYLEETFEEPQPAQTLAPAPSVSPAPQPPRDAAPTPEDILGLIGLVDPNTP